MSKGLSRLIKLRDWQDSFRALYPASGTFSKYYETIRGEGATRIDRSYHFGVIKIVETKYLPIAFSDHFALLVKISVPGTLSRAFSPKSRSSFKLTPELIKDPIFQERLEASMKTFNRVRDFQGSNSIDVLQWWELLVKPGVLRLGLEHSKEVNKEKREALNLLLRRQMYLTKKIKDGVTYKLGELKTVHLLIEQWYSKESEKVQHQSRVREFQVAEQTSIYTTMNNYTRRCRRRLPS